MRVIARDVRSYWAAGALRKPSPSLGCGIYSSEVAPRTRALLLKIMATCCGYLCATSLDHARLFDGFKKTRTRTTRKSASHLCYALGDGGVSCYGPAICVG